jgi:hypothetical protein
MTDTAQPETAAETEVVSDPIADAANAFKMNFPETLAIQPERPRDEAGRFVSTQEEIEAEAEEAPEAPEAEAESPEEEETPEAAEEAQPEAIDLPTSWPAEQAETWKSLPPEAQAFIREREGERDAAVNAKFQEAANVKRANEALIAEANTNRQRFLEETEFVLGLVNPQEPPETMLDPASSDYNPDAYHRSMAQYRRSVGLIDQMRQRVHQTRAQQHEEVQREHYQRLAEINERHGPALLSDVPDIADEAKAGQAIADIARYAVSQGVPEEQFADPELRANITAPMLHILWKAQQFDRMKAAKAKVVPKAAKPAAPPVKPGVTTPRSAVEGAKKKAALDRLDREGSVQAGADFFKTLKF